MYWKQPHINKIYEALSAIADERIKLESNKIAKVYSTSGNKFYTVEYDKENRLIISDDNSAYYADTLSYPMIAMLMLLGEIEYNKELLQYLKGIKWKDLNQKYKNDYDKSTREVLESLKSKGVDIEPLEKEVERIYSKVKELKLGFLGEKRIPSKVY